MTLPTSMVMTRIGGRDYPLRSIPSCKTCQSPHRLEAEAMLLTSGRTPAAIARSLPEDAGLTGDNLRDHFNNGHMPLQVEVQRRLVERRALKVGKDLESATELLVDQVVLAEAIVQKTYERLAAGEIEPDTADGIAAARFLHAVERDESGGLDQEMWVTAVNAIFEVVSEEVEDAVWAKIGERLAAHPALRALAKEREKKEMEAIEG